MPNKTDQKQFKQLVVDAQRGQVKPLNEFFNQLKEGVIQSLLSTTRDRDQAEEEFQNAVAYFWEKVVISQKEGDIENIEGYIFRIAKYSYLKQASKRSRVDLLPPEEIPPTSETASNDHLKAEEHLEEQQLEYLKIVAIKRAISKLNPTGQKLYTLFLEENRSKPREIFEDLQLKNPRVAASTKERCKRQLSALAAIELEELLQSQNYKSNEESNS